MMKTVYRGVLVGLLHLLIVSSLGAKLLYDRETLPRIWVRTVPVDPNMPIRGRYVRLQVEMKLRGSRADPGQKGPNGQPQQVYRRANLSTEDGELVATVDEQDGSVPIIVRSENANTVTRLREPLAFFIPEHVRDPSQRSAGEELWVEVTVPKTGPPRPIRLGVKESENPSDPVPLDLN